MKNQTSKNKKAQKKTARRPGAYVSVNPTTKIQNSTKSVNISGEDRLEHLDLITPKHGQVILEVEIVPGMFPRLKDLAAAYQRIKYKQLTFKVNTSCSTSTGGDGVLAFVADPDDNIPRGSEGLNFLTANARSKTFKFWSNASTSYGSNKWYYTSPGVEARQFSPGKLVVMCDGSATDPLSMTISCHWKVELSTATYDKQEELMLPTLKEGLVLSTQGTHTGLWGHDISAGTFTDDATAIFNFDYGDPSLYEKGKIAFLWQVQPVLTYTDSSETHIFRQIAISSTGTKWEVWPKSIDTNVFHNGAFTATIPWINTSDVITPVVVGGNPGGSDSAAVFHPGRPIGRLSRKTGLISDCRPPITESMRTLSLLKKQLKAGLNPLSLRDQ